MDREALLAWVLERYSTEPDYPWGDRNAVLRHTGNKKWYGLLMEVGRDKVGRQGDGVIDILNVKCDPILIGSYRTQQGFAPAYHMNKDQWLTIFLDGSAPERDIKALLEMSYELTRPKRRSAAQNPT